MRGEGDGWGRTRTTALAMAVSGACAALIGLTYGRSPWLVLAVGIVWGIAVIADSAQFSTMVTELADQSYVGTALTTLIRQSREDLAPALAHLENVVAVLNKNEDNLDSSLRLMAPFYRVFANTLGTGPWFDTWIANFPPVPQVG